MKLYTRTICPKCKWVKSELNRFDAVVEEINIDHDAEASGYLMDAGILAVPVVELDNGEFLTTPTAILEYLQRVQ